MNNQERLRLPPFVNEAGDEINFEVAVQVIPEDDDYVIHPLHLYLIKEVDGKEQLYAFGGNGAAELMFGFNGLLREAYEKHCAIVQSMEEERKMDEKRYIDETNAQAVMGKPKEEL